ncbi:hypothetical protein D3C80_1991890 [compost metagenome]
MAGEHVEVTAQLLHIVAPVHHTLGAIDHGQRALRASMGEQSWQRLPGAQHIGQLADGKHARARANQLQGLVEVDAAMRVHWQHDQTHVAPLRQLLPGQ